MGMRTEDTITLTVDWENESGGRGTGVYTASWIAPKSDVHSQQRFFYMGTKGELNVDQAHRGYTVATDAEGYKSANPLFMKYEPDAQGRFAGQSGYGYRSIEDFVEAARAIREGKSEPADYRDRLATVQDTVWVTAILEAGRRSLDEGGSVIELEV
jgi:D-galacturonate reductase